MTNVNIEITTQTHNEEHARRPSNSTPYRSIKAVIEVTGGANLQVSDLTGINAADFTEKALNKYVASAIGNEYEPADLTVTGVTLPQAIQTHVSSKFEADDTINSIIFN